jgi:hypothetical protein
MTANAFYIRAQLCYDTVCTPDVPVFWVEDFDGTETSSYAIIMISSDVGSAPAGVWVKDAESRWRFLIPYDEASRLFSTKDGLLKVILNNTVTQSFPTGDFTVFRNGGIEIPPAIEPSEFDVWAITEPDNSSLANFVSKSSTATDQGYLQISSNASRTIEDFLPGVEGVVLVDANDKAYVNETIELVSGGGLVVGKILKP